MADFSISITRETARTVFTQADITVGTSSPGAGAVELRIDRTSSGDITVMDILMALEKFESYFLTNGFLYSTSPSLGKISNDD